MNHRTTNVSKENIDIKQFSQPVPGGLQGWTGRVRRGPQTEAKFKIKIILSRFELKFEGYGP